MLAALCCVATMIIKIPSPLKGYMNLGDCIVLLSGFLLSPTYAFLAASVGSALADAISGYMIYVPATFVIKGVMALVVHALFKFSKEKLHIAAARILSGISAELVMILGYYVFEGLLYGFAPSAVNIPSNAVQGIAGLIIGVLLAKIFDKRKISF